MDYIHFDDLTSWYFRGKWFRLCFLAEHVIRLPARQFVLFPY